ncbi:MAG TPA: hypothetical protein VEY71_06890 [Chitinophagales bacterium]|nr:hypothetical protein [Chitinophagales bacterium]
MFLPSFRLALVACALLFSMVACKKEKQEPTPVAEPMLVFRFKFDSTQQRLNNIGQPSTIPSGRAAQSPTFNQMSAHYVELAPTAFTALGAGEVLYKAPETNAGGATAIDFNQSVRAGHNETFLKIPIKDVAAGNYSWLRVSLAYQNYDIRYKSSLLSGNQMGTGTVASFIGFNTFIADYVINQESVAVNANKPQGYWGFETMGFTTTGQAPAGATTVPNPISSTSPIPAGSCVVTGAFDQPLVITGNETKDIEITVSLSTNNSFEWTDDGDGLFQPEVGDAVVDMGIRGMIPFVQY